jgi:hypothetical protein
LSAKAKEAHAYCTAKKMNTQWCILVDMGLHSGHSRFFVWDFSKDTLTHAFPVAHGCCNMPWGMTWTKDSPTFSNIEGSHCSSLGRYSIGARGWSNWGINVKYLLHGLDSTNSNALSRTIVLHSWEMVPDSTVFPSGTSEGWGCPAISDNNMRTLDKLLKTSDKAVLMWMFN